jgi:predicted metal-dependent phosphoesterase TrpH
MSSPLRLDLHVHSRHSPDGTMTVQRLVGALPSAGVHGFALTDHNTVAGVPELRDIAARRPDLVLLPGVEVSTREGHLLVYGVGEAPPAGLPFADALDWARAQQGVAIPAHPFRWFHGVGRRIAETASVPGLETLNGHTGPRANRATASVAAGRQIGATGGSDTHLPGELGRAYTEFPEGVRTLEEVLDALRRGRTRPGGSGSGPFRRAGSACRSGILRVARGLRPI